MSRVWALLLQPAFPEAQGQACRCCHYPCDDLLSLRSGCSSAMRDGSPSSAATALYCYVLCFFLRPVLRVLVVGVALAQLASLAASCPPVVTAAPAAAPAASAPLADGGRTGMQHNHIVPTPQPWQQQGRQHDAEAERGRQGGRVVGSLGRSAADAIESDRARRRRGMSSVPLVVMAEASRGGGRARWSRVEEEEE